MMITLAKVDCAILPQGKHPVGSQSADRFAGASERPAYEVHLQKPVGIACCPVTEAEYAEFTDSVERSNLPVVNVSWDDARAYCDWLKAHTGYDWRLPSEAEWEVACRAGTSGPFSTGDHLEPTAANYYYDESGQRVGVGARTPVGSYPPNAWGLHDMHGNVCEWCADAWHPSHDGAPTEGSARNGDASSLRVVRGGAWDLLPRLLRSSWRDGLPTSTRRDNLGFRLAATLE